MTEPSRPDGPAEPDDTEDSPTQPAAAEASAVAAPTRVLGLTAFTMEGRRAPALFVVGWLATLIGGGFVAMRFLGLEGLAGTVIALVGVMLAAIGLVLLGGSQAVERRAAGLPYAGPSPVVVFLAALAAIPAIAGVLGIPLVALGIKLPVPLGNLVLELVKLVVFFGVVRFMVIGSDALTWREMGLRGSRAEALRGLLAGAVYAGPIVLGTAILAYLAVQLTGATPPSPLPPSTDTVSLVSNLVIAVVLAPISEELLFRGFALTAWQRSIGARGAIVRSSIAFVLAHVLAVGGDSFAQAATLALVAGVARIPVAVALGWLYVRTGSLWAPIGLHAAYNAILVVIAAGVTVAAG